MEHALLEGDHRHAHPKPHHRRITKIVQVLATIAVVFVIVIGLEVSIRDVNSSLQHTNAVNQEIFESLRNSNAQLRTQLRQLNHSLRGTVEGLETDIHDVNSSLQHTNAVNQATFEALRRSDDQLRNQLGQLNHSLRGTVEGLETDIHDVNSSLQHTNAVNQATFESLRISDDQLRTQLSLINARECRICTEVYSPNRGSDMGCTEWSGSWSAWQPCDAGGCSQRFLLECRTPR